VRRLADGPQLVEPGPDIFGREFGELLPAKARYQVLVDDGGVPGVGGLAKLVDADVLQPVRQEGSEAALRGDGGETAVAGRDLLGQLGKGLRPCCAVDADAFAGVAGGEGVAGGFPATALSLVDGAVTVRAQAPRGWSTSSEMRLRMPWAWTAYPPARTKPCSAAAARASRGRRAGR
jgi:hypothetical protein